TVTLGSVDRAAIQEAERQIKLILNPPTAEVGQVYPGRVVNITKFGAFVNILPGRDGLLHISKIGGGKRIDKVEDVFQLGDEVEVKVDDIDPNGKISLSLTSDVAVPEGTGSGSGDGGSAERGNGDGVARETVSFEEAFDAEVREEFGDLGPAPTGGGDGGGARGGERRRRGGRGRR